MSVRYSVEEDSSSDFLPVDSISRDPNKQLRQRSVLVIEDSPIDYRVILHFLNKAKGVDFRPMRAEDLATGLKCLDDHDFDVVLLDLLLPDCDGLETFRRVHSRVPLTPIVVLSGIDDESTAIQAVREGAQDYLVKAQFDRNLLVRAIRYSIARQRTKAKLARALTLVRASEQNLRSMITGNIDGMIVVDSAGTMRFLNPAAEALFGRPMDELLHASFGFPVGTSEPTEMEISHSDGRKVPVEMQSAGVSWEGRAAHLVVLRDLTRQKQAEGERAQLEGIARSTEDAIISMDFDGIILGLNAGGEKIFGCRAGVAIGQHVSMLAPQEERENVIAVLNQVKHGENVSQVGVMRRLDDDRQIDVSLSMFPIRDTEDKVVSIGGIIRDITEREQTRRKIRESESRYKSLFEDSPVPLREEDFSDVKHYIDGLRNTGIEDFRTHFENHPEAVSECAERVEVTDANTATLELYGAKSKDDFRERFAASFDESSRDRFRDELIAIAEGATKYECQTIARTFTGVDRDVALRWTVAPGYEQTLSCVRVSTVDITEIQRTQKELREHEVRLSVAQDIQEGLLPQCAPNLDGLDVAGDLSPAQFAAGDYFDYLTMADGSIGFAVGDVSGHGFGPALLMAATSGHLRSLVRTNDDVEEVMCLLNRALVEGTNAKNFVTMFLGRLDLQTRSFSYTSAGHPSGYVLDRSGQVRAELKSTGLPLAITLDAEFPAGPPVILEPGDTVLLLTDGFLEARSLDRGYFDWGHVLDVIRANMAEPASIMIKRLYQAVREFVQEETLDDDLTAVIIKVES